MEDLLTSTSKKATSQDWQEGPVAETIEDQTAKIPSDFFLWGAVGAIGVSLALKLMGKNDKALFVGQWVAPVLLLGVYNKIVKTLGHDQKDTGNNQGATTSGF